MDIFSRIQNKKKLTEGELLVSNIKSKDNVIRFKTLCGTKKKELKIFFDVNRNAHYKFLTQIVWMIDNKKLKIPTPKELQIYLNNIQANNLFDCLNGIMNFIGLCFSKKLFGSFSKLKYQYLYKTILYTLYTEYDILQLNSVKIYKLKKSINYLYSYAIDSAEINPRIGNKKNLQNMKEYMEELFDKYMERKTADSEDSDEDCEGYESDEQNNDEISDELTEIDVVDEFITNYINIGRTTKSLPIQHIYNKFSKWYNREAFDGACPSKKELENYFAELGKVIKNGKILHVSYKRRK